MENLAGDLLLGLKFVQLPILPTMFIHFVQGRLGELRSGYLGFKRLPYELVPHKTTNHENNQLSGADVLVQ